MDEITPVAPEKEEKPKQAWQMKKESWYDHLNVTVRQLDMIIWGACGGLVLVFVLIILDALNII